MNKHLKVILKKMCQIVGADFDLMDFEQKDWYFGYSWTVSEEKMFREWLKNYLKKNKEARNELMNWPSKKEKALEDVAGWFVFNYGWKYKD